MRKTVCMIFFFLASVAVYSAKPSFFILDDECVIFIQGNNQRPEEAVSGEALVNAAQKNGVQVWYIKQSQYDKIGFGGNMFLQLADFQQDGSRVILYKKGGSYYNISLKEEDFEQKANAYFGRNIFPEFPDRKWTAYENSYEGAIYIKRSEKELYHLESEYLDADEYDILIQADKDNRLKLISNLKLLKIPYKEADPNIKEIKFPNGYSVPLENNGGNIILFRQGNAPEVKLLSEGNFETLIRYFGRNR